MSSVKGKMTEIIRLQPEDATYEEIMRDWHSKEWSRVDWMIQDKDEFCPIVRWGN